MRCLVNFQNSSFSPTHNSYRTVVHILDKMSVHSCSQRRR